MKNQLTVSIIVGSLCICCLFPSYSNPCDKFQFPESLKSKEGSDLFEKLLSDPADINARRLLIDYYTIKNLPIEAAVFRRSLEEVSGSSHESSSDYFDNNRELGFSIFCSTYSGISREETRRLQDATRKRGEILSKESAQFPCEVTKKAEIGISDIAYGCPLVVEWAYANFLCAIIHREEASIEDLELSFRSLLELDTRGFLPHSTPTSTDLYFFLSQSFSQFDDVLTAIVLAEISAERFPTIEGNSPFQSLTPNISKGDIQEYIDGLIRGRGTKDP